MYDFFTWEEDRPQQVTPSTTCAATHTPAARGEGCEGQANQNAVVAQCRLQISDHLLFTASEEVWLTD
jgi:hypothetical protein